MTRFSKTCVALFGFFLFAFAVPGFAQEPQDDLSFDLFSGTLHQTADGLFLRRCAIGADKYRLFAAPNAQEVLAKLVAIRAQHPASTPISVGLVASYRAGQGDTHELLVKETMDDLAVGNSCHLSDFLEGLNRGDPKALEQSQQIQQELERIKKLP